MKTSIDQVGVENAMKLKMVELQGRLTSGGIIPRVIVTSDSLFGEPFYPKRKK